VGFRVVELLARRHGPVTWRSKFDARTAQVPALGALLAMPQTYMNDSGDSVAPLASFYKLAPPQLLVVCDDVNLPFRRLRARRSGSEGGHNGLRSIIDALHSDDFPRLRVGVGRPGPAPLIGHVIGPFSADEEAALDEVIGRAADGVEAFLRDGVEAAIALVNAEGGWLVEPE